MGSDDDIIRNGTVRQWWRYTVVFFGASEGYDKIEGGLRVKGYWLVGVAALLGAIVGHALS